LRSIVRAPRDEGNLAPERLLAYATSPLLHPSSVPLALAALQVILDIEDRIATTDALNTLLVLALSVQELLPEDAVVGVRRGLLNDDLFPVIADLVNDPFGALSKLQLVEGLDTLRGNRNTIDGGGMSVTLARLGVVTYPD
jgi:hypothetical protein